MTSMEMIKQELFTFYNIFWFKIVISFKIHTHTNFTIHNIAIFPIKNKVIFVLEKTTYMPNPNRNFPSILA